jgi:hypothetical protein
MPPVDPPDPLSPPPANFNREWAEFCVKYAEAHKRNPPWVWAPSSRC